MGVLTKYRSLGTADQILVAQSFALLCAVRGGLSVLPYRTVYRVLEQTSQPRRARRSSADHDEYRQRVVRAVRTVARKLLGDKPCLPQALAAKWFLRRAGIDATLRIGVRKGEEKELLAHAWLEYESAVIIGGPSSPDQYRPLAPVSGMAQGANVGN